VTAPLVVLCLNGVDDRVVDALMAAGRLPHLAALARRGSVVRFDTLGEALADGVWPTLLSGSGAGDHGIAHFTRFEPATMGLRQQREGEVEPFWLHLPGRGRGGLVLDAPGIHPHPASAADASCGLLDLAPPHRPVTTTRSLRRLLAGLHAERIAEFDHPPTLAEERALSARLAGRAQRVGRWLAGAAPGRPLVVAGFGEPHAVVHLLAHHWIPGHWHRPWPPEPELVARPYEAVDDAVGRVLQAVEDANVVVVAAHGMRPANPAGHLLEELVVRAGLCARAGEGGGPGPGAAGGAVGVGAVGVVERLRRAVPADRRERIAQRVFPRGLQQALQSRAFRAAYDWSRTQVFPLPSWTTGYLRVNLAGREVAGTVPPEDFDAVVDRVLALLARTVDAETGRPLVRDVLVPRRHLGGERVDDMPDCVLVWAGDRPARGARHPELGEWWGEPRVPRYRWGEHRNGGRAWLAGPDVRPGVLRDGDALDLAPTLLALAGCRPPSTMRGEVWRDVLA
jgi:predicted AlkP superfamily phosphohydrolase/phosphomutase